ncbi:NADP-dependent alkenal double bond reductase P2 [Lolium perenne]|uniref:NADP-dependent alkenal double bond reductase P2 n=1 Tax=Lolium perenne TaxID=4522 RepID=UPI0021EA0AE8|nr:NADP-dependent alkenal double bond reductase P2-like [Lolium perenne]
MEVENRYIAIRHHVEGSPSVDDFEVKTAAVRWTPESGEVLVKNMYLSIDPYQLNRMKRQSASHHSVDVILPGERIGSTGVGEVVASACPEYEVGDVVAGVLAWEEYTLFRPSPAVLMVKVDASSGFPLSYQVGVLGTSGMTAYGGLFEVGKPQKGEKVFVSAASGSVGSLVGQFAKLAGCYVVGCAGTQAKVDMLKDKLGFDDAFNYKDEPDLKSALKKYFPDGIDIYFENVGGEMLNAALANMNTYGRVAVCGVIAEYTDPGKRASPDFLEIIYKRITLRGFFAYDFMAKFHEFMGIIGDWIREDKVQAVEDISEGLESVPSAFVALYRGQNVGKTLVKLA